MWFLLFVLSGIKENLTSKNTLKGKERKSGCPKVAGLNRVKIEREGSGGPGARFPLSPAPRKAGHPASRVFTCLEDSKARASSVPEGQLSGAGAEGWQAVEEALSPGQPKCYGCRGPKERKGQEGGAGSSGKDWEPDTRSPICERASKVKMGLLTPKKGEEMTKYFGRKAWDQRQGGFSLLFFFSLFRLIHKRQEIKKGMGITLNSTIRLTPINKLVNNQFRSLVN